MDSRVTDASLQLAAAGDVCRAGEEEQNGGTEEHNVEHDGYQLPFLLPMTQMPPMSSVFC
jgi:hypothetical protein